MLATPIPQRVPQKGVSIDWWRLPLFTCGTPSFSVIPCPRENAHSACPLFSLSSVVSHLLPLWRAFLIGEVLSFVAAQLPRCSSLLSSRNRRSCRRFARWEDTLLEEVADYAQVSCSSFPVVPARSQVLQHFLSPSNKGWRSLPVPQP